MSYVFFIAFNLPAEFQAVTNFGQHFSDQIGGYSECVFHRSQSVSPSLAVRTFNSHFSELAKVFTADAFLIAFKSSVKFAL